MQNVRLSGIEAVQRASGVVACCKHLCGCATGLSAIRHILPLTGGRHDADQPGAAARGAARHSTLHVRMCPCGMRSATAAGASAPGWTALSTSRPRRRLRWRRVQLTHLIPTRCSAVKGVVIALCCHHVCDWRRYCNPARARRSTPSITCSRSTSHKRWASRRASLASFRACPGAAPPRVCTHSSPHSWAVCGTRTDSDTVEQGDGSEAVPTTAAADADDEPEHQAADAEADSLRSAMHPRVTGAIWCVTWRCRAVLGRAGQAAAGRACKRVLDLGRLDYMRRHGFTAQLLVRHPSAALALTRRSNTQTST